VEVFHELEKAMNPSGGTMVQYVMETKLLNLAHVMGMDSLSGLRPDGFYEPPRADPYAWW
jgi:hypothetical protein